MAASDWSERTRMLVTIAVAVVINAGLGFWFWTAHKRLGELELEYSKQKKRIAELQAFVNQKNDLDAKLTGLRKRLSEKESKLSVYHEVEALMENMSKLADTSGALLKSASRQIAEPPQPGANYARTVWRTSWNADFMSWCKVLNAMEERFPRFISFDNLVITPANSGMIPSGTKHDITVDVVAYRYLPKS